MLKRQRQQEPIFLVAEGFEAAGINSSLELTTFTLIPQISNAVSIPVIAAGGIGDGKGLAAALMLGASGVQMGTRFIATKEAQLHDNYKEKAASGKRNRYKDCRSLCRPSEKGFTIELCGKDISSRKRGIKFRRI